MDRKKLHPKVVEILKLYADKPITAANKILDLFSVSVEFCEHKDKTRTSDEYILCHDCDKYIYYPKQN